MYKYKGRTIECCVFDCGTGVDMPHHKFPKNRELFALWKRAIFSEKIASLTDPELAKRFVCYKHFKEQDYITGYKTRRLIRGAVPSIVLSCDEVNDTGVSIPNIEVEVSENVQPSCSFKVQDGSTAPAHDMCSVARNTAVETQVSENVVKKYQSKLQLRRKQRLCLLERSIKVAELIPQKARLYHTAHILQRRHAHSQKKLFSVTATLREAKKFYRSKTMQHLMRNLSPAEQTSLHMQLTNSKYAPQGRQYTQEEKILCLSIYKHSGRAYRFLETLFQLPSTKVLQKLLRTLILQPGLNKNLLDHLARETPNMTRLNKLCCLMWDEMSIQPHVDVSPVLQRIVGFEDHGTVQRPKFADVVLVFMLRGIKKGWKLPLAFYFSDGQTNSTALKSCIKEVTEAAVNSGLRIVAYVCDQGTSNVKAVKDLVAETASQAPPNSTLSGNTIYMYDQQIVAVYDPPHLIKAVRNNLLTKNLQASRGCGEGHTHLSWKIIELAYEMDQLHPDCALLRKLTDQHVRPECIKKMRVKHAVQVLSGSMARYIAHHTYMNVSGMVGPTGERVVLPQTEAREAANIVQFFNDLFDSCNGSTTRSQDPWNTLRVAVSKTSPHTQFWKTAVARLKEMQFVDPTNRQITQRSAVFKNWITTVQGLENLNVILQAEGLKHWFPRYIMQDPLENFFGSVRRLGACANKPTANQFINLFKTLIITNIATPPSAASNCESEDTGDVLFDLSILLRTPNNSSNITVEEGNVTCFQSPTSRSCQHADPHFYHKILKRFVNFEPLQTCASCNDNITQNLVASCAQAQETLSQYLDLNCHRADIINILNTMLYRNVDFNFSNCPHVQHVKDVFVNTAVKFFLQNWTFKINRILMTKKKPRAPATDLEILAFQKSRKTAKKYRVSVPPPSAR